MGNEDMVHIHNGILSSCNKNKIVKFIGKRVKLEKITLSEVTHTQKDKHLIFVNASSESLDVSI